MLPLLPLLVRRLPLWRALLRELLLLMLLPWLAGRPAVCSPSSSWAGCSMGAAGGWATESPPVWVLASSPPAQMPSAGPMLLAWSASSATAFASGSGTAAWEPSEGAASGGGCRESERVAVAGSSSCARLTLDWCRLLMPAPARLPDAALSCPTELSLGARPSGPAGGR